MTRNNENFLNNDMGNNNKKNGNEKPHKKNGLLVIGITGNTGSGKTTVSNILAQMGGYVINADELSHQMILKGQPAYDDIICKFGTGILTGGEIDRKKLGALVFGDAAKLKRLEETIHPRVAEETLRLMAAANAQALNNPCDAPAFIVLDAPLLIEAGMNRHCDRVWVVTADAAVKERRIIQRDGLTPEAAAMRIQNQRSEAWLIARGDDVINNNHELCKLTNTIAFMMGCIQSCK
jgi:dephospho-CoA kinase